MTEVWPVAALAALGVYHGVNPAMGWLFAVGLGLQERRRAAVLRALLPIAVGHEASVVAVVLLASVARVVAAPDLVRVAGAALLLLFGAHKLLRPGRHPAWVGMHLGRRELVAWSFLMTSAHGAGLMLLPLLLGLPADHADRVPGLDPALGVASALTGAAGALVHTAAMLVAMGAVAYLAYERFGLTLLRRAWLNLDAAWAAAIVLTGLFTLFT